MSRRSEHAARVRRLLTSPTEHAFADATAKLGSIERYVRAGLLEYDFPLTRLSLRVAQMRDAIPDPFEECR